MFKKILLILTATIIAAASLFGFAKLNADQIDKNDYIKKIHEVNETIYLRGKNDALGRIDDLSVFEKKNLIKYPNLTSDSKILFKDTDGNLIIRDVNEIFLINEKGQKTEIPNQPNIQFVHFSNKEAIYFNQLTTQLFVYDFETKEHTEIKYLNEPDYLFHTIISIDSRYAFVMIQKENELSVVRVDIKSKEITEQKKFTDKTKINVIRKFDRVYVIEVREDNISCYTVVKHETFRSFFRDTQNKKLNDNFFFNGTYYINGTVFKYVSTVHQTLSTDSISVVEELEDSLYLKIRKNDELQYYYNGKKMHISKDIKVYNTKEELIFKETNDSKYKTYDYSNNSVSELELDGILLFVSDRTYLILKDNELILINKSTQETQKIDVKDFKKITIHDTLDNIKQDIKTQGNKILEFVKTNWFYFAVGFIGLFSFIFISVKLSNRKRRR